MSKNKNMRLDLNDLKIHLELEITEENIFKSPWYWFMSIVGCAALVLGFKSLVVVPTILMSAFGYFLALAMLFAAHSWRSISRQYKDQIAGWNKFISHLEDSDFTINQLYSKDGKLLVSPGDVIDKVVILYIKKQKIKDKKKLEVVDEELERLKILGDHIFMTVEESVELKVSQLYKKLYEINLEQWDWEDKVRTEQSWEAAVKARECNTRRVNVKCEINRVLGYPTEIKEYKTNE